MDHNGVDGIIHLPGTPVTHASEAAELEHQRRKWEATIGPRADAFVARAMARAALIAAARKGPDS
jgi:hypothetical protein